MGTVPSISAIPRLHFRIVAGAAAGNVTVTGVALTDKLYYVGGFSAVYNSGAIDTLTPLNLTSEFTITAANTVNNTSGTASTGGLLLVIWYAPPTGGEAATAFDAAN